MTRWKGLLSFLSPNSPPIEPLWRLKVAEYWADGARERDNRGYWTAAWSLFAASRAGSSLICRARICRSWIVSGLRAVPQVLVSSFGLWYCHKSWSLCWSRGRCGACLQGLLIIFGGHSSDFSRQHHGTHIHSIQLQAL